MPRYKVFWRCGRCGRKHISNERDDKNPPGTECKKCGYTGENRWTEDYYRTD